MRSPRRRAPSPPPAPRAAVLLLSIAFLPACDLAERSFGPLVNEVPIQLYTEYCAPPPSERIPQVRTDSPNTLRMAWDPLCFRDGLDPEYLNIKVAWADDRSDDFWEVWYLRPVLSGADYAEDDLPGANIAANPSAPDAHLRIPARPLTPGSYVVRVDAVAGELFETDENGIPRNLGALSITTGETLVHVLDDDTDPTE